MLDWSLPGGQDQYLKTIPELAAERLHRRERDGDKQEVRYKLSRCALSRGENGNVTHFGKMR